MFLSFITVLSLGCLPILVNGGKLVYYNDRWPVKVPQDPFPNFYPNYDLLPVEEYDTVQYLPSWFPLSWQPIPLASAEVAVPVPEPYIPSEAPQVEVTSPPSTEAPDDLPEGRHLHNKHRKHHKHHKHQPEVVVYKDSNLLYEPEELLNADARQLKLVILQIEHKLQELKLQLFGSRTLTVDDGASVGEAEDSTTTGDTDLKEAKNLNEQKQPAVDATTQRPTEAATNSGEQDEGKILLDENDKPTAELQVEHREIEADGLFDKGRSLTENVQKWFEGLDLSKIASLPLEESDERVDILNTIDVRSQF